MRIDNPLLFGSLTTSGSFLFKASGSFTGSFTGDGSKLTNIIPQGTVSSSAQLASAISGSINSLTSSFFTSASVSKNTITFTQANGSTSALTVDTGSSSGGGSGAGFPFSGNAVITGSLRVSGSNISGSFVGDGSGLTGVSPDPFQPIIVTVVLSEYVFGGNTTKPNITLARGFKYRFDTSDSTCLDNPLGFRTRNNTSFTNGVTTNGTAGTAGAYTEIDVGFNTPTQLRYYSTVNGNSFGALINVQDQFNAIFENGVIVTGSAYITDRVGISTNIPEAQLHIKSNEDVTMILESDLDDTDENDNPKIVFKQDGGNTQSEIGLGGLGAQYTEALNDSAFFGTTTNHPVQLITNDVARLTILSGGNVGINEKSPDTTLHVGGIVSASFLRGDGSGITNLSATISGSIDYGNITNKPTLVSGSQQIDYRIINNTPNNLISSSAQVAFSQINGLPVSLVSGSSQITFSEITGLPYIVSSSTQVKNRLPSNTVSSSAQIDYNSIQNQPTIPAETDFSASFQNLIVKVVNDGGDKYQIDGVTAPKLTLQKGHTYRFDMSDNTNSGHPLLFRTREGTTSYSDGVHQNGSAGSAGAYTQIHVKQDAPNQLRYYCTVHGNGMGNSIAVQSAFNTIIEDNLVVSGSLNVTGDITAYSTSDERLKTNITPILDSLNKIGEIQGYEYDWIENEYHTNIGHDIGVIAQEIEKIAPEAVSTRDNGYKAVKYEKLVPILIQAIKELNEKVNKLENVHR
tara:strand:+ start:3319 stop:5550 length:2232 start_codon:yes stop_codon:yes gene_type:complete